MGTREPERKISQLLLLLLAAIIRAATLAVSESNKNKEQHCDNDSSVFLIITAIIAIIAIVAAVTFPHLVLFTFDLWIPLQLPSR